jgi:hypothetical protein
MDYAHILASVVVLQFEGLIVPPIDIVSFRMTSRAILRACRRANQMAASRVRDALYDSIRLAVPKIGPINAKLVDDLVAYVTQLGGLFVGPLVFRGLSCESIGFPDPNRPAAPRTHKMEPKYDIQIRTFIPVSSVPRTTETCIAMALCNIFIAHDVSVIMKSTGVGGKSRDLRRDYSRMEYVPTEDERWTQARWRWHDRGCRGSITIAPDLWTPVARNLLEMHEYGIAHLCDDTKEGGMMKILARELNLDAWCKSGWNATRWWIAHIDAVRIHHLTSVECN